MHYVDEKIDTGDIVLQKVFQITDQDNYKTLLEKAHIEAAKYINTIITKESQNEH